MENIFTFQLLCAIAGPALSLLTRHLVSKGYIRQSIINGLAILAVISLVGFVCYLAASLLNLAGPAGIGVGLGLLLGLPIITLVVAMIRQRSNR